jgi:hypothetical protein
MYTTQETQDPETAVLNAGRLTQVLNFLTEVGRRVGLSGGDNVPPVSILILFIDFILFTFPLSFPRKPNELHYHFLPLPLPRFIWL